MKKMTGDSKTSHAGRSKFVGYRCSGHKAKSCAQKTVKKDSIEAAVIDFLETKVFNDDFIGSLSEQIYKQYAKSISEANNSIPILETKLKDIERKIRNNMQAIEDGLYTPTIKNRLQELEIDKIETTRLIYEERQKKKNSFTLEQVKEFIGQGKNISAMNFEHQKKIINTFIDRITVNDDDFKIDFYINMKLNASINTSVTLDLSDVSVVSGDGGS